MPSEKQSTTEHITFGLKDFEITQCSISIQYCSVSVGYSSGLVDAKLIGYTCFCDDLTNCVVLTGYEFIT